MLRKGNFEKKHTDKTLEREWQQKDLMSYGTVNGMENNNLDWNIIKRKVKKKKAQLNEYK